MKVVIDIEANGLENPTQIWCIVCKDIDTGEVRRFREVTKNPEEFIDYVHAAREATWIGHNVLGYDIPVLVRLLGISWDHFPTNRIIDTLIVSKLVDFSRKGHSIEDYGREFGLEKVAFSDFSKYSREMEDYCVRDVEICEGIYRKYLRYINNPERQPSIRLEHRFQLIVNDLHSNGFAFNTIKAQSLLENVETQLAALDKDILSEFPPRQVLVREFTPRATKYGTVSKTSVPRSLWSNIHEYEIGQTYPVYREEIFNPSSHKQLISVLREAGWRPVDKTKAYLDAERQSNRLKFTRRDVQGEQEYSLLQARLIDLQKSGWKINENNLGTLPDDAPKPARLLAKRILLESRRRTLTEWLGLANPETGRIHGKFYGIGAWTHRMSHQNPNTANIPNEFDTQGNKKLLGKEMRSLWIAPRKRLLVGVDAEGIQLRIFAHYINDPEFTRSLVGGRKDDKTDPHSLNQRVLGAACKSRAAAKRFIYALLLGAGIGKLAEVLAASNEETSAALERLLDRYQGFAYLKEQVIPADAKRGWFVGLDGRAVRIPGDTVGSRKHLAMSGYLQNGEAIVVKKAVCRADDIFKKEKIDQIWVDIIHDETQSETNNRLDTALFVAKTIDESIVWAGEDLGLKCPMAGSYRNEDLRDYTIGTNWSVTH